MYKVYCDEYLIFDDTMNELKIFSPKVTTELNKTGSFTFTIYATHPYFEKLQRLKSIITVYQGNYLLFRGRILNCDEGFHNELAVTCEGELAFLVDSIQRPYDFYSGDKHTTIKELFTFFITNHNAQVGSEHQFTVGEITVTDENDYIVRSDSTYSNTWDSINNKLIKSFGGYLQVRHEDGVNYIDYLADFSVMGNQTIKFGENLLDYSKSINGEDIATAIIPLGTKLDNSSDERLDIKSVNNDVDYVYNQEAVDRYGWIFKTVTWDDVTLASNLLTKGQAYLDESINTITSIEVTAVDLSGIKDKINAFHLGTYLKVESEPHNLDAYYRVEKLSIDLMNPANNKITLGASFASFTDTNNQSKYEINNFITQTESSITNINGSMNQMDERVQTSISQATSEITAAVTEQVYLKSDVDSLISQVSTRITQNANDITYNFDYFNTQLSNAQTATDAKFTDISTYIRFSSAGIEMGKAGDPLVLKIGSDRISFYMNNSEVSYWADQKFYVTDGEFLQSLTLGNFAFRPRANQNLSFIRLKDKAVTT